MTIMELSQIKTPHFTMQELVQSNKADLLGINNTPSVGVVRNLCTLIMEVLEPARVKLGAPITVTSGYRCVDLNKAVGGVGNSQHMKGQAADLQCFTNRKQNLPLMRQLFDILKEMDIDQVLWERDSKGTQWVHVSYVAAGKNRSYVNNNYKAK